MSIELLAPEILLLIVNRLPDLDALYNLLRASPHSLRLFNEYALSITEAILSGPRSLLTPEIQELIRAVILTRSSSLPFHTLDELDYSFMRGIMPQSNRSFSVHVDLGPACIASPEQTVNPAPAVLLSAVATARHISVLTHSCLASYLARVNGPTFTPQHCHDPNFRYTRGYGRGNDWVPAWQREFAGEPVPVLDAGPPSWVEEMRVTRAMWFVQLVGEVQRAASAGALGWPLEDVERMSRLEPEDLAAIQGLPHTYLGGAEEVRTVTDYLKELARGRNDDVHAGERLYYTLPRPPTHALHATWASQEPETCETTWANQGYMYRYVNGDTVTRDKPSPEVRLLHKFPQRSEGSRWGQTPSALSSEAPGVSFFVGLTMMAGFSPLVDIQFDSFRQLGFGIWDQRRMHLLGVLNGADPPHRPSEFFYFAWKSLLSAEEIARLKAALQLQVD